MSSRRKSPSIYTSSEDEILKNVKPQEVLKKHEEEIVSALQGIDIVDFSKKLLKESVFREWLKNKVSSLDINGLDCRVGVRYLIRLVYESVRSNDVAWHRFIHVLSSFGYDVEQNGIWLKHTNHPKHHSMRNKRFECGDFILQESDITKLTETIAPCSHKWEEIGIALRLPCNVVEECRSCSSNAIRLNKVLNSWKVYCHEHTVPVLRRNLIDALAGPLVGYRDIAAKLEEEFYPKVPSKYEFSMENCSRTMPYSETTGEGLVRILYISHGVEVRYGKSTILGVEVGVLTPG